MSRRAEQAPPKPKQGKPRKAKRPVPERSGETGPLAYLEVALATMAAATTGVLYSAFFTTRDYLPPILVAAAGAAILAALTAIRRWRTLTTLLTALLGFAALAVGLVYRDTLDHAVPTLRTATGLGTGLLHGWARMLSVGLPADVNDDLLITPVLVTFVATFVSTTIALRTRVVLAPALPTLLALVIGLLFTASVPAAGLPVTAAWLLTTLLLIIVRVIRLETARAVQPDVTAPPDPRRRRRLVGRIAFGLPVALLVAALGVTGARFVPVAAGTNRFDPRTVTPQQYAIEDTLTPLVGLKSQLNENPARTLFTVQFTSDPGTLDRVRTAALDDYDGALWTSDDTFLVAGHTLPKDPNLEHPRLVSARVSIQDLTGPYLPVVGWPVKVGASGLGFSAGSGVLVSHDSLHGLSYDLVGAVAPDDAGLRSAVPNLTDGLTHDTKLPPGIPPELSQKAVDLTSTASTPYAKLLAIQDYLRKLPYSTGPKARPGHSYDALRRLFSPDSHDRLGYAEQYAAAFAVLARAQGFPTRVAVGYLLRTIRRNGDMYTVTTADAHAWPEVDLAGYGWVAFEPTDFTVQPNDNTPPPQTPTPGDPGPNNANKPGPNPTVDPNLKAGPDTRTRILTGTLLGLIILVALGFLLVFAVVLAKFVRRRRHRSGSGAQRIVGAWRDSTDRLVERGIEVPRSLTAIEAARHAEEQLGEPARAVAVLAPLVTQAVFYPGEPPDDAIREAWELNAQFRRDLRRSRGVLRAMRAWFNPRPLVYAGRDRRALRRSLKRMQEG